MRWWLLLSYFVAFSAFAESACTPVDLRDRLGPPLDQGDSSYCFAHTSATLIRARLGVSVSPMQLATNYILANPDELSGAADPAVKRLQTPAFFEKWHKDRTEEPNNYSVKKILSTDGLLDTGGEEMQTLVVANYLGLCDERRLPTGHNVYKKYLDSIVAYHTRRVKEGIPPEETERPLGEVTDPDARGMAWSWRHWVERRCGQTFLPSEPLVPHELTLAANLRQFRVLQRRRSPLVAEGQNAVLAEINRQLDRDNPVSIGYALSDIMPDQKAVLAGQPVPADVDHASVIAGRREVKGRCYYYLRNSFGPGSGGYIPALKGRIENGGAWVLPEELPSLYGATWLE